jgi:uncharacterized coiled-coil DUF342 family protein
MLHPLTAALLVFAWLGAYGCAAPQTSTERAHDEMNDFRAAVRKAVPDPARSQQVIGLADQLEKLVEEANAEARSFHERLTTLNANYDATEADFAKLLAERESTRRAWRERVLAARTGIAQHLTDAEWKQLESARAEALISSLEAAQQR